METNNADQLPEAITLGGTTYKVSETPELLSYLDTVRKSIAKTEKSKLYSQIEELQKEIKVLSKVSITDQGKNQLDQEAFKKEILNEMKQTFQPLIEQVTKKTTFLEAGQVADYRNRLLMENQGKCFPELVVGDTKEAIDEAFKKSQELWEKYNPGTPQAVQTTKANEKPIVTNTEPQTTVKPLPATPKIPASNVEDLKISDMSQEEFAKRRGELEQKLKTLVS